MDDKLTTFEKYYAKTLDYGNRLDGRDKLMSTDAINRDMRRHPDRWKQDSKGKLHRESSGIFESVQFINE